METLVQNEATIIKGRVYKCVVLTKTRNLTVVLVEAKLEMDAQEKVRQTYPGSRLMNTYRVI